MLRLEFWNEDADAAENTRRAPDFEASSIDGENI